MNSKTTDFLFPEWPAPDNVKSVITLRFPGSSQMPYDGFNLADHVGDNPADVLANRQQLTKSLGLCNQPAWLHQVHGTQVIYAPEVSSNVSADASYTDQVGEACVVLTADCLPVLLCNQGGTKVAAAHAGWRGLCDGIVRNTVACFSSHETVLAYLGPAIGPEVYEVGTDVVEAFISSAQNNHHKALIEAAFIPSKSSSYMADLYALARAELIACGVEQIYGGGSCTYSQSEQFFSYRRDQVTGRNATLIWLERS